MRKRTKPRADRVPGICTGLGCFAVLPPGRKSPECVDCKRVRVRDSEAKWDPSTLKARKAANMRKDYHLHPDKRKSRSAHSRKTLRNELLTAYGNACSCCGESEAAFLTLEHKRRDGKAHRDSLSGGHNNSISVYRDLKRRGWPQENYTLLCFNCNHASWKLGVCPHQKAGSGKRLRVLLDCDGILSNFIAPSMAILNRLSGLRHKPKDLREWDVLSLYPKTHKDAFFTECNQPGFCDSLPVIHGAVEFVTALRQMADVYIVTSPMNSNPTWVWEREQWLLKHFGFQPKQIVHTTAKYICAGDVLIDDHPGNIELWEKSHAHKGGVGVLWDTVYNRASTVGVRAKGPAHALSLVKNLQLRT